ncbi:MAG: hypothetical protein O2960_28865 [Verrucomicrobia bacterium]|nr:hypothetical protein [Verrucomicrobiota bacterium]
MLLTITKRVSVPAEVIEAFNASYHISTVRLWSCPGGEPVNTLGSIDTMDGHTGWVMCLTFSPDGHLLASGGLDNTARLWKVSDGTLIKTLEGHDSRVTSVAFSPDGATLASGSWDRTVRLWRSELSRLSRVPVARTTLDDLAWTQEALSDHKLAKSDSRRAKAPRPEEHGRNEHRRTDGRGRVFMGGAGSCQVGFGSGRSDLRPR